MPATLVANLLPSARSPRTAQRSSSAAPGAPGDDFVAVLSEARQADRPIARTPEPAAPQQPRRAQSAAGDKAAEARRSRDRQAQPTDTADQPTPAAHTSESTAEDEVLLPAVDETPSVDVVTEPELADDEPDDLALAEAAIDPALLPLPQALDMAAVEGETVADESQADAPTAQAAPQPVPARLRIVPKAAEEQAAPEGAVEDGAETPQQESAAIDLSELGEAEMEDLAAPEKPVILPQGAAAGSSARTQQAAATTPARTPQEMAAGEALPATAQEQPAQRDGQDTSNGTMQRPPTSAAPEALVADEAPTEAFDTKLDSTDPPSTEPSSAGGEGATARTQQTLERPVVRHEAPAPLRQFVQENHERIVNAVRTQILPNGGSMQIRLSPGDLGQMQITVQVVDGALSATFLTSSDDATRLLSHSLTQLKSALETQGVNVERIQVAQAPREPHAARHDDGQPQQRDNPSRQQQQETMQQEQQRRHLLNRMWQRMVDGGDPLDLVA